MRCPSARAFAAAGIASLRFDKRGVGASEGEYWTATFQDETDDASAALHKIRDLASGPVVVLGHSVGATIAMRLAAGSAPPDGCVLLAGAASGEDVMVWQSQRIADTFPAPLRLFRPWFLKHQAALRTAIRAAPDTETKVRRHDTNVVWMKEYMAFDPCDALRNIRVPVLAITGAKDIQVDADDLTTIGEIVAGPCELQRPPHLSHLLRDDTRPPGIRTYPKQLKEPMSESLVAAVIDWIARRYPSAT